MTRWFAAELEGSYVGLPSAKGPAHDARRHQLQVYRAALRDLRWLEAPRAQKAQVAIDEPAAVRSESADAIDPLGQRAAASDAPVRVGPESASAIDRLGQRAAATDAPVPVGSDSATAIAGLAPHAAPVLRQLRIDHAHVAGVRGPGTWYEGPIFDLVIHSFRLTHATEHEGRPYGRIVGSAVGWLELPPEPVQPEVHVSEIVVPTPVPLSAAVYRTSKAAASKPGAATDRDRAAERGATAERGAPAERDTAAERDIASTEADRVRSQSQPEFDGEPDAEEPGETAAPSSTPSPFLLPLTLSVIVVGLGLLVASGAGSAGLWTLFMLPTLLARRLFAGVLRDGGFLRGFGYACIAVQAFCVSQLVSSAWSTGCPQLALLPMLGVIAGLFPAGLLPSIIPLSCNAIGLALVLATLGQTPASTCGRGQPTEVPNVRSAHEN